MGRSSDRAVIGFYLAGPLGAAIGASMGDGGSRGPQYSPKDYDASTARVFEDRRMRYLEEFPYEGPQRFELKEPGRDDTHFTTIDQIIHYYQPPYGPGDLGYKLMDLARKATTPEARAEFVEKLGESLSWNETNRLVRLAQWYGANASPDNSLYPGTLPGVELRSRDWKELEMDLNDVLNSARHSEHFLQKYAAAWMNETGQTYVPVFDRDGREIVDMQQHAPFHRSSHFEGDTILEYPIKNRQGVTFTARPEAVAEAKAAMEELWKDPKKLADELLTTDFPKKDTQKMETALIWLEDFSGLAPQQQEAKVRELREVLEARLSTMESHNAGLIRFVTGKYPDHQVRRAACGSEMITTLMLKEFEKEPAPQVKDAAVAAEQVRGKEAQK